MAPVAIIVASISMASGIGGAVFFAPIFMLVLELDPKAAIGAALLTALFGFSSGLLAYMRRCLIDYRGSLATVSVDRAIDPDPASSYIRAAGIAQRSKLTPGPMGARSSQAGAHSRRSLKVHR